MNLSNKIRSISRLPIYYNIVCEAICSGKDCISSAEIAALVNMDDSQVRKDISITECVGKPKKGYNLYELKRQLKKYLGLDVKREALIIGVGNLGTSLAKYDGFSKYGLEIKALFDNDPNKIGISINNKTIKPINDLKNHVNKQETQVAILSVPFQEANKTATMISNLGIKAIWNFTQAPLFLSKDVIIWNEDIASSFMVFSQLLSNKISFYE